MQDQVLCTVKASGARRMFGVGVLMLLGAMLIYIAFAQPPENMGWQIFLVLMGAGALYLGDKMRRATLVTLELTETTLRDSNGMVLVEIADIKSTDRGTFAFKPSNGFILRLDSRATRVWQPGLWWRMGKRIGVGGVTSAGETKQMAEMIAGLVAMRDGEL
ncbi:MAG: hypothetical protein Q9M48_04355 [Rhodobacterales bacterium]|nr:hypothetical protein [Rhodobacterales bacterium]